MCRIVGDRCKAVNAAKVYADARGHGRRIEVRRPWPKVPSRDLFDQIRII
jgi:hypothetical protein